MSVIIPFVQILERFKLHLLCIQKVSSYADVIGTEGADAIDYRPKDRCVMSHVQVDDSTLKNAGEVKASFS
jgi:hypothetical protein